MSRRRAWAPLFERGPGAPTAPPPPSEEQAQTKGERRKGGKEAAAADAAGEEEPEGNAEVELGVEAWRCQRHCSFAPPERSAPAKAGAAAAVRHSSTMLIEQQEPHEARQQKAAPQLVDIALHQQNGQQATASPACASLQARLAARRAERARRTHTERHDAKRSGKLPPREQRGSTERFEAGSLRLP